MSTEKNLGTEIRSALGSATARVTGGFKRAFDGRVGAENPLKRPVMALREYQNEKMQAAADLVTAESATWKAP